MYLVLEELNEENKNENVSTYLSAANPYIWEGENSGDPAVFYEFKKSFEKKDLSMIMVMISYLII